MESSKEVFFDINFKTFIASEEIRGGTFYGNYKTDSERPYPLWC